MAPARRRRQRARASVTAGACAARADFTAASTAPCVGSVPVPRSRAGVRGGRGGLGQVRAAVGPRCVQLRGVAGAAVGAELALTGGPFQRRGVRAGSRRGGPGVLPGVPAHLLVVAGAAVGDVVPGVAPGGQAGEAAARGRPLAAQSGSLPAARGAAGRGPGWVAARAEVAGGGRGVSGLSHSGFLCHSWGGLLGCGGVSPGSAGRFPHVRGRRRRRLRGHRTVGGGQVAGQERPDLVRRRRRTRQVGFRRVDRALRPGVEHIVKPCPSRGRPSGRHGPQTPGRTYRRGGQVGEQLRLAAAGSRRRRRARLQASSWRAATRRCSASRTLCRRCG